MEGLAAQARPRALVVEDDPAVRRALVRVLESVGVDALQAEDGAAGLRALVDNVLTLDLLVTDLEMPGLSGEALVRTVRHQGGEHELRIMVVSGKLDEARTARLYAAGVDLVLDKADGLGAFANAALRLMAARAAAATDTLLDAAAEEAAALVFEESEASERAEQAAERDRAEEEQAATPLPFARLPLGRLPKARA